MQTEYVSREQYDREIAALTAEIRSLKSVLAAAERNFSFRIQQLEMDSPPLKSVYRPIEY